MDSLASQGKTESGQRLWILLGSAFFLAFLVAFSMRHAAMSTLQTPLAVPLTLTIWQDFLMAGSLILLLFLLIRVLRFSSFLSALFAVALFLGAWVYCWSIFPWDVALLVASIGTVAQAQIRRVIVHNIFFLVGTAGVVIHFAFMFSDRSLLMIFAGLIFYDMVVGRQGGSIVKSASEMVHRGIVPGLIIPERGIGLLQSIRYVMAKPGSVFVGSGDVLVPMVLVARSAIFGWWQAVAVTLGLLIGYAIIGFRTSLKPFPALLPIGLGVAIPYFLIAFLR